MPAPLPTSISPVASRQPPRHKERNKREAELSYKLEHIWRRNKTAAAAAAGRKCALGTRRLRRSPADKEPSAFPAAGTSQPGIVSSPDGPDQPNPPLAFINDHSGPTKFITMLNGWSLRPDFMFISASQDYRIICNLPCQLPISKINGEASRKSEVEII